MTNTLNELAIADFLLFGSHTWLDKSITPFADIQKLPPASSLSWSGGELVIKPYWDFPLEVPLLKYKNDQDYIEHFRTVFKICVQDRLRCDRAVIAMSGGMDSTAVAATACQLVGEGASSTQLQAVTAVYDHIHPDRERYFAGLVAKKLELPIDYFVCDNYALLQPPCPPVEPSENYTPIQGVDLARRMASYSPVLLTGDCADNLLCLPPSPTIFSRLRQKNLLAIVQEALQLKLRHNIRLSLGTGLIAKFRGRSRQNSDAPAYAFPSWLNPSFTERLQLRERWQQVWSWHPSPLNQRHPAVHRWMVFPNWYRESEYLDETKSHALENRDPFLDLRLIELILAISPYPWLFRKYLIRRAMQEVLPDPVVQRPKTPLGNLQDSLVRRAGTDWLDRWKPVPELSAYIVSHEIPKITSAEIGSEGIYTGLRPLLLNLWLVHLNNTIS
ncbi:MAG: asparagine synthase [Chloroflexaceae bacterium]|nr:asparagine synthase [Chloroflexaceae bacterium]